jgi:hypothetical protein
MQHQNTEFLPMHAFAPYLLAIHQRDLLQEAESTRRARLAAAAQRGVPAWRRGHRGFHHLAARSEEPTNRLRQGNGRAARPNAG